MRTQHSHPIRGRAALLAFAALIGATACERSAEADAGPPANGKLRLGMNLAAPTYYTGERSFMNLAMGDNWRILDAANQNVAQPGQIDPKGHVRFLAPGSRAVLTLTPPAVSGRVEIQCTFEGKGRIKAVASVTDFSSGNGTLKLWTTIKWPKPGLFQIEITETDQADPIRAIDCREEGADRQALYAKPFLDFVGRFETVRFMDWAQTNANKGGKWAERTQPDSFIHSRDMGVAIEHMIDLASQAKVDAWFCIPFNADEDYIRRYAQLVHDRLPPERKAYVELSNEVWNWQFPQATAAKDEGARLALAPGIAKQNFWSYARRTIAMHDIFAEVFKDRPGQLVRVIGSQAANPDVAVQILSYAGEPAKHADALATAPYFAAPVPRDQIGKMSAEAILAAAEAQARERTKMFEDNAAVAKRFGLRHIAYEAGQHVVIPDNVPLNEQVQRAPKMYDAYRAYLEGWRRSQGDLMMLFNSTGGAGWFGQWGHREYELQPMAETPKLRAVYDALEQQP